jgi:hypothetical protein
LHLSHRHAQARIIDPAEFVTLPDLQDPLLAEKLEPELEAVRAESHPFGVYYLPEEDLAGQPSPRSPHTVSGAHRGLNVLHRIFTGREFERGSLRTVA